MFVNKQAVLKLLDETKISYQRVEHEAVYTIDEMKKLNLPDAECIAKNLFVRDDKKKLECYHKSAVPNCKEMR